METWSTNWKWADSQETYGKRWRIGLKWGKKVVQKSTFFKWDDLKFYIRVLMEFLFIFNKSSTESNLNRFFVRFSGEFIITSKARDD